MDSLARRRLTAAALAVIGLPTLLLLLLSRTGPFGGLSDRSAVAADFAQISEQAAVARIYAISPDDFSASNSLVQLLCDPRPAVVTSAQQKLSEQLDRWRMLPASRTNGHVVNLASRLADVAPELPADGRRHVSDLAVRLICWPIDGSEEQSARLVDHCERILAVGNSRAALRPPAQTSVPTTELPTEVLRWPSSPPRRVVAQPTAPAGAWQHRDSQPMPTSHPMTSGPSTGLAEEPTKASTANDRNREYELTGGEDSNPVEANSLEPETLEPEKPSPKKPPLLPRGPDLNLRR